ncbi:MAG TPA: hypothetical protein VE619_04040 [Nitrososphaeraceae archaeon]|nr:hypothetical protein [Nitrososphaeraceae archaeon]
MRSSCQQTISAASVAKLLRSIMYRESKNDVIRQSQENAGKIYDADSVINALNRISTDI